VDADGMVEPVASGLREVAGGDGLDIAGFSFGGMLAGLLAAADPGLVGHVVMVGAPGLGLRADGLKLKDWRHLPDRAARDAIHRENMHALMLHDPQQIDDFSLALHAANLDRDRVRHRRLAGTDILARKLPLLRCRVDGIWGESDALYTGLMGELAALLRSMPTFGELVVLPGAGHWVAFEQAESFNGELLRLLAAP
jgi:pimeloyl-ACP methyl ester carboxylesterase